MKTFGPSLIFFFFLTLQVEGSSNSTLILDCAGKTENWTGRIQLDSVGAALLIAEFNHKRFECALAVSDFNYSNLSESNQLLIRMKVKACVNSRKQTFTNNYLLPTINFVSNSSTKRIVTGNIQWITYLSPTVCTMKTLDLRELVRAGEKWNQHLWP